MRGRRLKALGWDLVEITYDDVAKRPTQTGRQLHRLYHQRLQAVRSLQPDSIAASDN